MSARASEPPDVLAWDGYATRWADLHGGYDPRHASPVVRGWLRLAFHVARLLARVRVSPNVITVLGLLLSVAVPVSSRWPLLAALFVLLSALADTVDGALAVLTERVSRLGQVYDSAADRISEACWLLALTLLGAPVWLTVACGAVAWLHEYVRARASVAGMSDIGTVTVAERPTRILVVLFGLAAVGVTGLAVAATVATAVWAALGAIALVQLSVAVQRALRDRR